MEITKAQNAALARIAREKDEWVTAYQIGQSSPMMDNLMIRGLVTARKASRRGSVVTEYKLSTADG